MIPRHKVINNLKHEAFEKVSLLTPGRKDLEKRKNKMEADNQEIY